MLTNLQTRLKKAGRLLPVALLPFAAHAQFNYSSANAVNVAGTYTDLGTSGTAITTANTDDANSAAQPIGFNFSYNRAVFTQFVLNTNGLIKLGSTAPATAALYYENFNGGMGIDPLSVGGAAETNLIMPFNTDLQQGTGTAEYRVATSGTSPNQVCTIQWKNVSDKSEPSPAGAPSQYANFSFQAKLYENGNIEFVYGNATASTSTASGRFPNVGLKGSSTAANQLTLALKPAPASPWSATTFISENYRQFAHNVSNASLPDPGRTYRFAPTVSLNNDVAVKTIYTLGTVSSTYSSPATAQVVVTNAGSSTQTNLPVTLTVSGTTTYTNTQTVATLAAGASTTLTFTYPLAGTIGINTLTATVPADDLATNNSQTFDQTVSSNVISYLSGNTITGAIGQPAAAGNVIATGYRTTGTASVTTVTPYFVGPSATGSTYQVLIYSAATNGEPGAVLYTSPARPRPGTAGGVATDIVTIPTVGVNGAFFIGIKTLGADNIALATQTETPLRTGTFFFALNGTTWTDFSTSTVNARVIVEVTLGTALAIRNEALAATVSLYPNPAHQSFKLTLPAGSLNTASASLINALGQVVQTRQLSLPTAGGSTDFNVSGLAAGVYSLQLKSGNDLVVKRVVVE